MTTPINSEEPDFCGYYDDETPNEAAIELNSEGLEALVTKVARAIGATPAKAGGPVGKYLWDVDLANAARAAIEAYRKAIGVEG
jgi:hypothetical protein